MKKKTWKIKKYIIIIIVNKKHENVVKTGFAQIFSCFSKKMGGCSPLAPPPSPPEKDKLFFKLLRSSYFFGWKKDIPFLD